MQFAWRGVFPALTTQFRADGSLDVEATLRHLEVMIESGIDGVVFHGTLGEGPSMQPHEKLQVLQAAVSRFGGRLPILSGVAEYTTNLACRYAGDAEDLGIDGLMVLPAMVYKSDERETVAHLRAVAQSVRLPIMIYNNPVSYGVDLSPQAFRAFEDLANVVAIKESSDDPRRITDIQAAVGPRFALFCGVDDLVLECAAAGAVGWVAGLGNAYPRENALLWRLLQDGHWEEARAVYRWYMPLLHLDTHPKLVQYIKLAMQENGLGSEHCRAPRLRLEGAERESVLRIIRAAAGGCPGLEDGRTP